MLKCEILPYSQYFIIEVMQNAYIKFVLKPVQELQIKNH